jgi:hypothetical protein
MYELDNFFRDKRNAPVLDPMTVLFLNLGMVVVELYLSIFAYVCVKCLVAHNSSFRPLYIKLCISQMVDDNGIRI